MTALVVAEHDNASIKGATLNTVTAAAACGSEVHVLVAGHNAAAAAQAAAQIAGVAKEAGLTPAQFALAWVLREPNVASAIVGASRPEQPDDNCGALERQADPALSAKAEAIADAVPRR